jgi:hypothetical protein
MRGSISAFRNISLVALVAVTVLAPATVSAAPKPKETEVLFISRAELEAAGLMTSDALGPTSQLWCMWDCNYARNSRSVGTSNEFVTRVSGPGPGTLAMDITRQVSNSFTATVTVGADKISAAVGFSVTWTDSQTYKYSTTLPSGACWTIRAYNTMDNYAFEVWQNAFIGPDFKVGTGGAKRFMGIKFTLTKAC